MVRCGWRAKASAAELIYNMLTGDKPPVRTAVRALVDAGQLAIRVAIAQRCRA